MAIAVAWARKIRCATSGAFVVLFTSTIAGKDITCSKAAAIAGTFSKRTVIADERLVALTLAFSEVANAMSRTVIGAWKGWDVALGTREIGCAMANASRMVASTLAGISAIARTLAVAAIIECHEQAQAVALAIGAITGTMATAVIRAREIRSSASTALEVRQAVARTGGSVASPAVEAGLRADGSAAVLRVERCETRAVAC